MRRSRLQDEDRQKRIRRLSSEPLVFKDIGPPHNKQKAILKHLFTPNSELVKQVDIVCGRGFGKSLFCIFIACIALSMASSVVGLFLEPDWKRVVRVFLKKWFHHVPRELYTINKGEQCITWINGALLFYGARNITGSYSSAEDSQLGQDTSFVIDDEAALRCSYGMYTNTLATVRVPGPYRFYSDCIQLRE